MQLSYYQRAATRAAQTRARIRRAGYMPNGARLWSAEEDDIVRQYYPDFKKLMQLLPGRSYYAIRSRSQFLGIAKRKKLWLMPEVSRLRKVYAKTSQQELMQQFPSFSWERIKCKARHMGLSRKTWELKATGIVVIDEIRRRCARLRLSMVDLDEIADTGQYFQKANWNNTGRPDWIRVHKAISALDGKVLIQWDDAESVNAVLKLAA